jgi:hypothetical protein
MDDYPSNSRFEKEVKVEEIKENPKKVEKLVEGKVIRRKKPLGKKFAEVFIGGDSRSVGSYILYDILIPATKDTLADMMSQGVERMLFGEVRSTSRRPYQRRNQNGYVSYNQVSRRQPPWEQQRHEPRVPSRKARATHDFDEIVLDSRTEAEEVIDRLFDLVSQYESATVKDFYELVGVPTNYTDDKWGWSDIRGAGVTRVRNGYLIDLPKPEPLD